MSSVGFASHTMGLELEDVGDVAIPPIREKQELLERLEECVCAEDWRSLQAYVLEQHLPAPEQFMELVGLMAPSLTAHNLEHKVQLFTTIRRCLTYFSRHGRPKEMVLAFLEAVEGYQDDDVRVVTLLPCLQCALLQLPVKRGRSLELALDTVGCHLAAIPAPRSWDLEGEEIKLLETDENVRRFLELVPAFLDFMRPFLEAAGGGKKEGSSGRQWEVRAMKKHLLKLLKHPLSFLDLRFDAKEERASKTYSREMGEKVVQCLAMVEKNFYRLAIQQPGEEEEDAAASSRVPRDSETSASPSTAHVEDIDMEEENRENERRASGVESPKMDREEVSSSVEERLPGGQLSAACLLYLVEVEGQGQQCWPAVVSADHLLHCCLPCVLALLTHPAHTAVHKGLALFSFHLDTIPRFRLDADFLDDPNVMPVVNALIIVMRRCPIRQLRFWSLTVFRSFFTALACGGRYQLMRSVLASCDHAGVKSVVVGLLKDEINMALRETQKHDGVEIASDSQAPKCELVGSATPKDDTVPSDRTKLVGDTEPANLPKPELVGSTKPKDFIKFQSVRLKRIRDSSERNDSTVTDETEQLQEYFLNNKLKQLLVLATRLPDDAASDLLEESDLVMSTLNLLRYLVLRDTRHSNRTGIWTMWAWLEESYLSKLQVGLDMSVGHYQLELRSLSHQQSQSQSRGGGAAAGRQSVEATLSVAGMTLPPMGQEQRLSVMSSALTTFDMMKCVLARLCELVDMKKKA